MRLLLIFLSLSSLFFACQSRYVSLDYKVVPQAVINTDSTSIYFLLSKMAFRKAVGVSRFPDGGQPGYQLEDLTLYQFDLIQDTLVKHYEFSDLAREKVNLSTHIIPNDSAVLCSVFPNTDWEVYLKNESSERRRKEISRLSQQYNDSAFMLIDDGIIVSKLSLSQISGRESMEYSITAIMKQLENVPLAALGFDLKSIYPKSDQEYIDECIYLKNDSPLTRRAIIEQVIAMLPREDIQSILKEMDDYANSLSGLEKKEYEIYSKSTYEQIKDLL